MSIDKYLYEIIESYKDADSEYKKSEIFNDFCFSIWNSKNKRRTYSKSIKFKVREDLLNTEIGKIFNNWSNVNYIGYKAMTKNTDWCNIIRQKINNLYTKYFDEDIILNKDYMDLLRTPKKLYYRWVDGEELNVSELTNIIDSSFCNASELRSIYQKQKMKLSWDEYKKLIEEFMKKIFNNCTPIDDYEIENLTDKYIHEFCNEDKSYIKYICKSLECYMLNYQKEYYKLKRGRNKDYKRCIECGKLIEIKSKKDHSTKYCDMCKKKIQKEKRIKYNKNYYNKQAKNKAKLLHIT